MILRANQSADRNQIARRKRKRLARHGWVNEIIGQAKRLANTLVDMPLSELQQHTDRLRRFRVGQDEENESRALILAAAAVIEAVRQALDIELFDTQLHAGIVVSNGAVAEMQTGEGKTLSVALPAYFRSLDGRGVHVATPNGYLASRDFEQLSPVFSRLGATTGLLIDDMPAEKSRVAYQADITYGPGHAFGFDYLRDQLTLDRFDSNQLGDDIYARLTGRRIEDQLLQRGLHAAIIDEIDHVLIDDAVSPLLLSSGGQGESPDADVHRAARDFSAKLQVDRDFVIEDGASIQLTDTGFRSVYEQEVLAVHPRLVRPWHEYVVLALRARHCYRRDVHFIVQSHQVQIVDATTGRIMPDRTWSDGLHQAIEARQGLEISCENEPLARITRQRFYRSYESLAGMTGTASGCGSRVFRGIWPANRCSAAAATFETDSVAQPLRRNAA